MRQIIPSAVMCWCLLGTLAQAKNIDLVTLPKRDTVQLTIYNSEDITLAKETRSVTLKKGTNKLQFSWAGTLIDPTSVSFRPLDHKDEIELADTVFPGQKPQHLIWTINSEFEGQALVEVSYFTSGLTWKMDYVAVTDPTEDTLTFDGHVRVFNNSGEEYENAEIRMIVGKINLVEKIADLARRSGQQPPQASAPNFTRLRQGAVMDLMSRAEGAALGGGAVGDNAKKIVKEGVSEYFMFSVEGSETISNGWSKRMPAVHADDVDFDIVYRMRSYQYGSRPVRFFTWSNSAEHHLGDNPLPDGTVRLFRENGQDGLSYLGQQNLNYVPIKADIEVNLGVDDLVVYEQRKVSTSRSDFQFNVHKQVTGWNERQSWVHSVRNYRSDPIVLELRLQWNGHVEVSATEDTTSFDFKTIETKLAAEPGEQTDYEFTATIHHGANAKQNRVQLKARR